MIALWYLERSLQVKGGVVPALPVRVYADTGRFWLVPQLKAPNSEVARRYLNCIDK